MRGCSTPEGVTADFTSPPAAASRAARARCSTPEGVTADFTASLIRFRRYRLSSAQRPKASLLTSRCPTIRRYAIRLCAQRPKASLLTSHHRAAEAGHADVGCSTPEGVTADFTAAPAGGPGARRGAQRPKASLLTSRRRRRPAAPGRQCAQRPKASLLTSREGEVGRVVAAGCSTPEGVTADFTHRVHERPGYPDRAQRPKASLLTSLRAVQLRDAIRLGEVLNARRRHC